jgi:DNA-binding NtrC family response regulator
MGKVLIVEDERRVRDGLARALASRGHEAVSVANLADARRALADAALGCVLLDLHLPDGDGLDLLTELPAGLPVIVATASAESDRAILAMRGGAFEYVTKPFDLPELMAAVARALRSRELSRDAAGVPAARAGTSALVGGSAAMLSVWKLIGRAAASDAPVLIVGETGTGKDLVAQTLHNHSARAAEPFVAVNVASLPPTLIESELMGHEKGAFTGAIARRIGRIEAAGKGTLFLDEIGDLDPQLQAKLLRVLQDGGFERVGGSERLQSHARVVAATNKVVQPGHRDAVLREEIYYRLAVLEIAIPPLRARKSDIPMLVAHALRRTRARAVSEPAMQHLLAYDWPGNVRELLHVVERAALLCASDVIDAADLPPAIQAPTVAAASEDTLVLRDAVAALERRLIERALERSGGNRAEAARLLGIARPQLYAKLAEHGITRG